MSFEDWKLVSLHLEFHFATVPGSNGSQKPYPLKFIGNAECQLRDPTLSFLALHLFVSHAGRHHAKHR